jgi:hypothetical protein
MWWAIDTSLTVGKTFPPLLSHSYYQATITSCNRILLWTLKHLSSLSSLPATCRPVDYWYTRTSHMQGCMLFIGQRQERNQVSFRSWAISRKHRDSIQPHSLFFVQFSVAGKGLTKWAMRWGDKQASMVGCILHHSCSTNCPHELNLSCCDKVITSMLNSNVGQWFWLWWGGRALDINQNLHCIQCAFTIPFLRLYAYD